MKVAIVHHFYRSSFPSGENAVVLKQAKLLEKAGNEVMIFSTNSDSLNIFKVFLNFSLLPFGYGKNLNKKILSYNPDVVHIHNTFPSISLKNLQKLKFAKVVTLHNFRLNCANGFHLRNAQKCQICLKRKNLSSLVYRCYKNSFFATLPMFIAQKRQYFAHLLMESDGIIVVNDQLFNMLSDYRIDFKKVHLLPNFTDSRNKIAQRKASKNFLFSGRLSEEKGISWLIKIYPKNAPTLDIYGAGQLYLGAKKANIELKGFLDSEILRSRLPEYEGLIFPSIWDEGMPMVLIEALEAGLPIIVNSQVSIASFLVKNNCAVEFHDGHTLESAMEYVVNNRKDMTKASRYLFDKMYSEEVWLKRIEEIYLISIRNFEN